MKTFSRIWRDLWFVPLGLALLALCFSFLSPPSDAALTPSSVAVHTHASVAQGGGALTPASLTMAGTLSSTKACAANYTRTGPNFCQFNNLNGGPISVTSSCSTNAAPASDAKMMLLNADALVRSDNAVGGPRGVIIQSFGGAGCASNPIQQFRGQVFEFVAQVALTAIGEVMGTMTAPVVSGNYFLQASFSNTNSLANVGIIGYFD